MQSAKARVKNSMGLVLIEEDMDPVDALKIDWAVHLEIDEDWVGADNLQFEVEGFDLAGNKTVQIVKGVDRFSKKQLDNQENPGGADQSYSFAFRLPFEMPDLPNLVNTSWKPNGADFNSPVNASDLSSNFSFPQGLGVGGKPFDLGSFGDVIGKGKGYLPDVAMLPDFNINMATAFSNLSGGGINLNICKLTSNVGTEGDAEAAAEANKIDIQQAQAAGSAGGSTAGIRAVGFGEGGMSTLAALNQYPSLGLNKFIGNNLSMGQSPLVRDYEKLMASFQTAAEVYHAALDIQAIAQAVALDPSSAITFSQALGYLGEAGMDYLKCQLHQLADSALTSAPIVGGYVRQQMGGGSLCGFGAVNAGGCDILQSLAKNNANVGRVLDRARQLQDDLGRLRTQIQDLQEIKSHVEGLTLSDGDLILRPLIIAGALIPMGYLVQAPLFLTSILGMGEGNGLASGGGLSIGGAQGSTTLNSDNFSSSATNLGAIAAPLMPFFVQMAGMGGPTGGRAAGATGAILSAMDDPTKLSVVYPPKGKVVGITSEGTNV